MASLQSVLGTLGDDTLTTDLTKDFVVDALDGDDTITVEETSSAVEIQAGKGEDKIVFSGDVETSEDQREPTQTFLTSRERLLHPLSMVEKQVTASNLAELSVVLLFQQIPARTQLQ